MTAANPKRTTVNADRAIPPIKPTSPRTRDRDRRWWALVLLAMADFVVVLDCSTAVAAP